MEKMFKAILIFGAAIFMLNCSGQTAEDYYNQAKENINQANYQEALNNFQKLLEEYPESEYAANAKFEIAQLYHGKAIKGISDKESFQKGIEYYNMAFEDRPEGSRSEKALFMIGYIQANELQQYEEAEKSLNRFIETFPNSELRPSAEEEIKNLGVPPEEILKRKVPAVD